MKKNNKKGLREKQFSLFLKFSKILFFLQNSFRLKKKQKNEKKRKLRPRE